MFKKALSTMFVALAAMIFAVTLSGVASAATPLKAPAIWSPGSKAVLTNYPRTTSLSWAYVKGATSYDVELACDTCVSTSTLYMNPQTFTTNLNYYVTSALAGDNTFRFRVRAKNYYSAGAWSKYRYFSFKTGSVQTTTPTVTTPTTDVPTTTPTTTSTTLRKPDIVTPLSNAVLTNYPRRAYMDWSYIEGATSYEVEVACDVCVSTTNRYSSPTTYIAYNNYYTTPALAGDNTFRVRVRAKNSSSTSLWSDYRYFSYRTVAATLDTPTITNPTSNQVLTNYPRTAYLDWTYINGATSYEVEVACDVCVSTSNRYLSPTTYIAYNNYYTTPALAGDNTFRVRVRAKNDSSTGGWSSYRYFSYKTVAATLGTPNIIIPESNGVLANYPRVAYLEWDPVTNATFYDVEVACDTCGSSTLYSNPETYTSYNSYYTTPALAGDNTFRFRVRAKNSTSTGAWSSYRYFSYDTSHLANLATPVVLRPWSNDVLTNYPRRAYLEWDYISGATSYDIEVACDTCSSTTNLYLNPSKYTSYNNYYTTPALAGDNTFRVRVRAKNDSLTGEWSYYQYFSYRTSATTPTYTTPTQY